MSDFILHNNISNRLIQICSVWNDVSWHNPLIHSPVLEELAGSGVLLDQYYVQPTCSPSRVAMMTGKYPYRYKHNWPHVLFSGNCMYIKVWPQCAQPAKIGCSGKGFDLGPSVTLKNVDV